MTHIARDELIRWRDQGLVADRERILPHLATCKACAQTYAELIRTEPVAGAPQHFDPADFVKRGYAVRQTATRSLSIRALVSWKLWTGALAAAAVVLLAVTITTRTGRDVVGDSRGPRIEIVTPSGPTPNLSSIEWRSGIVADTFRVELADPSGRVVYRTETRDDRIAIPLETQSTLRLAKECRYTITALDRDGQPIATCSGTVSIVAPMR